MSIKGKFLSMFLFVTVVVAVMTGITYRRSSVILTDQVMAVGLETVSTSSIALDEYMAKIMAMVDNSALTIGSLWYDEAKRGQAPMEDLMVAITDLNKKLGILSVYFGAEDDGAFSEGLRVRLGSDYDPRKRSWYIDAVASPGKVVVTEPYLSADSGKPLFSVAKAVFDQGKLVGVFGADVAMGVITDFAGGLRILGGGYALLLSSKGMVVVGADDKDTMKLNLLRDQVPPSVKEMAMDMTAGRSGHRIVDDRGERSWAFYRSTSSGLSLAVIYPNSAVSDLVRSLTYRLLIVSIMSVLAIALAIAVTYRGIDRPLRAVAALAERIGKGDLSVDLESVGYNCKDSLGAMIKALSYMVDGLKDTVRGIYSQSEMIASSAQGLSSLSDQSSEGSERVLRSIMEISALAEENSAALEQTNAGVEEVSSSTTMVADSSVQGAEAADSASRTSQEAVAMVVQVINGIRDVEGKTKRAIDTMTTLEVSVQSISGFIDTINSIADQTNLLALNAAIEAARAGEAGRGFAVVAEEVRKLAEESAQASGQIGSLIGNLQSKTRETAAINRESEEVMERTVIDADGARQGLDEVLRQMSLLNESMQNIAASAEEQSASTGEIAHAVDMASRSTQEMAVKVGSVKEGAESTVKVSDEVASQAERLSALAQEIKRGVEHFKLESPKGLSKV